MRLATRVLATSLVLALPVVGLVGCGSTPTSRDTADAKIEEANATLKTMMSKDPSAKEALDESHGYVVFSTVGSGALIVGGAGGGGVHTAGPDTPCQAASSALDHGTY